MKNKNIGKTILNKIPKVLLIIVVLFGLAVNQNSLFGTRLVEEENEETSKLEQLSAEVYKSNVTLSSEDAIQYEVRGSGGQIVGYVVSSMRFSDKSEGYGGRTPIAIFLSPERDIVEVKLLDNHETKGFVRELTNQGFFEKWKGQNIDSGVNNPDAISGVTLTSSSVLTNFDAAIQYAAVNKPQKQETTPLDWKNIAAQGAVLLVVALSLLCFFMPGKTRKLRIPVLLLSIAILGVWQGAFVSVELLYKWTIGGIPFAARFGLVLIVLLAFMLPLFLSKSWYCMYLCPFGALQELAGKLNPRKIALSSKTLTIFSWIRKIVLVTIVALLLFIPIFELSDLEPFTVFMIKSASLSVIIIASVSLVSSIFIQRAWCRLLCPTGELMSIFQKKVTIKKKKS